MGSRPHRGEKERRRRARALLLRLSRLLARACQRGGDPGRWEEARRGLRAALQDHGDLLPEGVRARLEGALGAAEGLPAPTREVCRALRTAVEEAVRALAPPVPVGAVVGAGFGAALLFAVGALAASLFPGGPARLTFYNANCSTLQFPREVALGLLDRLPGLSFPSAVPEGREVLFTLPPGPYLLKVRRDLVEIGWRGLRLVAFSPERPLSSVRVDQEEVLGVPAVERVLEGGRSYRVEVRCEGRAGPLHPSPPSATIPRSTPVGGDEHLL